MPTEDPNLPPPISDLPEPAARPIPTPRPATSHGSTTAGIGPVISSDIFYNGAINPNEPGEYVELRNRRAAAVSLEGWMVRDGYGSQEFTWRNFTLQAGQRIRSYTNDSHPASGGFSCGSNQAIWRNKGDAAELQALSGAVVATVAYGNKR